MQPPPPSLLSIYAAEHNIFPSFFFLETYPIPFLRICIPDVGLKSHYPAPCVFFFKKSCVWPPPPLLSHIHTYPPFSISPSFFRSGLSNQCTKPKIFVVTNPTPPLASIMFIINCSPPYPYLYFWPPLTSYIHLFLHLRLFLSVLTWSETKMNRRCI